jgi:hypothetical protein
MTYKNDVNALGARHNLFYLAPHIRFTEDTDSKLIYTIS